jgi:hypothetical protein
VEEYSTTWPWINDILGWKMDDKSNGWTFIKDGCQTYENSWMTHYLIHKGQNNFMLVLFFKIKHMKCWCNILSQTSFFFKWIFTTSKPFRNLN